MTYLKPAFLRTFALLAFTILAFACSEDDPVVTPEPEQKDPDPEPDPAPTLVTRYFVGVEAGTDPATDVLANAESLTTGTITPVNNGFEQPTWMSFFQNNKQIFTAGYTSAPEFTSYEIKDGELVKGESFFTDLGIYAVNFVDDTNLLLMGAVREGYADKKIYHINTNNMLITNTVTVGFGNDEENELISFPVDMQVRGDKLFVAYYMVSGTGDFSTPSANEAKVAVFSYPGLEFEKIITDNRASNIGRYYTANALEADEKGDIYTFSPSSLACGYAPVPENNSAILKIKNGETEFDADYYIDFETLSGGYKLNDMYYVGNGKAVVRVLKEDETNADYLWATYAPTSPLPLLETGIVDLYNETFTLVSDVPNGGGGWGGSYLVEDGKLYLGVSSSTYSSIYIIDPETATATEGATIDGNYAKALMALTTEE